MAMPYAATANACACVIQLPLNKNMLLDLEDYFGSFHWAAANAYISHSNFVSDCCAIFVWYFFLYSSSSLSLYLHLSFASIFSLYIYIFCRVGSRGLCDWALNRPVASHYALSLSHWGLTDFTLPCPTDRMLTFIRSAKTNISQRWASIFFSLSFRCMFVALLVTTCYELS